VYETWSLAWREEHRLKVSENGAEENSLQKRDEMVEDWRKLRNDDLHSLYSSPNIIRIIKSRRTREVGHVVRIGRRGKQIIGGKARRKGATRKTKTQVGV
jgi:hypothetical protein